VDPNRASKCAKPNWDICTASLLNVPLISRIFQECASFRNLGCLMMFKVLPFKFRWMIHLTKKNEDSFRGLRLSSRIEQGMKTDKIRFGVTKLSVFLFSHDCAGCSYLPRWLPPQPLHLDSSLLLKEISCWSCIPLWHVLFNLFAFLSSRSLELCECFHRKWTLFSGGPGADPLLIKRLVIIRAPIQGVPVIRVPI
jgi:hypothetical protein